MSIKKITCWLQVGGQMMYTSEFDTSGLKNEEIVEKFMDLAETEATGLCHQCSGEYDVGDDPKTPDFEDLYIEEED